MFAIQSQRDGSYLHDTSRSRGAQAGVGRMWGERAGCLVWDTESEALAVFCKEFRAYDVESMRLEVVCLPVEPQALVHYMAALELARVKVPAADVRSMILYLAKLPIPAAVEALRARYPQ